MDTFFDSHIVLENHRVKLVPFAHEYEAELKRIIFDEGMEYSVVCTRESDLKSYMNKTIDHRLNRNAYPFIVIDKKTNEVAGCTRYGNLIFANKRLEIGWTWYGKKFRGTGINKACKFELLKYAFESMNFRRVQFSADIDNVRSQRAILKLGAKQEGIFRANYINPKGESRDDVYFSIISAEWDELKRSHFKEFCE